MAHVIIGGLVGDSLLTPLLQLLSVRVLPHDRGRRLQPNTGPPGSVTISRT
jgi:hypothetical protein